MERNNLYLYKIKKKMYDFYNFKNGKNDLIKFLLDFTEIYVLQDNDLFLNIISYLDKDYIINMPHQIYNFESDMLCELNPSKYEDLDYEDDYSEYEENYDDDDDKYFDDDDGLPYMGPDYNERLQDLCDSYDDCYEKEFSIF